MHEEVFTHSGYAFFLTREGDGDTPAPWEEDNNSLVRHVRSKDDKRPGERVMKGYLGRGYYLFDWQAAARRARVEEWDAAPYGAPNRIERAVQSTFDYYNDYLAGNWWYEVLGLRFAGEGTEADYLGGVCSNGWEETAREMATNLIYSHENR